MSNDARRPAGAASTVPGALGVPRALRVGAAAGGDGLVPRWVVWRGRQRRVAALVEEWRVVDEWWREEICRHYFTVTLDDGRQITLFHDVLADNWWSHQR